MTTATFTQPDSTTQEAADYKASIDAATRVMSGIAAQLAVHEAATPNMTVVIDAGTLMSQGALVSIAQQATAAITAPVTHPRIDRIVVNQITGAITRVAGTEAASPTAPAVPAGTLPLARIALVTSTAAITNALITDERAGLWLPAINDFTEDTAPDLSADFAWVWDASAGTAKKVKLNKIGSSTDQVARDQIALTNIRLMLNSAITTGALVQGKQWELATDEWGSSSTNETYTAPGAFGYYHNPAGSAVIVASGTGTASQNFNSNAGAWTDGNNAQSSSAGSNRSSADTCYGKKQWPAAKSISAVRVYRPTDTGYDGTAGGATITVTVEGSATGAFSGEQVTLGSNTAADYDGGRGGAGAAAPTAGYDYIPVTVTPTAYEYHRVTISTGAGASGMRIAEIQFYEDFSAANMTLIPDAAVSVSSAPIYMDSIFLYKDDSGSAVLGTDFTGEHTRDGGTTWTAGDLSVIANYGDGFSVVKLRTDVSGQPSGTSMLHRLKALNGKPQRVGPGGLYSE